MDKMEEITGCIKYLFKGCPKPDGWFGCFFKSTFGREFKVTGVTRDILYPGADVILTGYFNGDDFVCVNVSRILNKSETIDYLASRFFSGIGPVVAKKIYDYFGDQTLAVIEKTPERLKEIKISDAKISVLHRGVCSHNIKRLLAKNYPMLKPKMINELVAYYDDEAVMILQTSPYDVVYDCETISFKIANEIAILVSVDESVRIEECLQYAVLELLSMRGDSYLDLSDNASNDRLLYHTYDLLGRNVAKDRIMSAFIGLASMPRLVVVELADKYLAYSKASFQAEKNTSVYIRRFLNDKALVGGSESLILSCIDDYQNRYKVTLDADQKQAVVTSLLNRVSIVTGGPGRGKTTMVAALIYCWKRLSDSDVILSAPTGKAARRLTGVVSEKFKDLNPAETIMRQLVMFKYASPEKQDTIKERYDGALVIVDECSMIGLQTASQMLSLYQNSQVVFVGDVDQLPSIESGQFFRDVCGCGVVPCVTLSTCHRVGDEKRLIENADAVNAGKSFATLDFKERSFWFSDFTIDSYQTYLIDRYLSYVASGVDLQDICVLCATNNGPTGVNELNLVFQNKLNPVDKNARPIDRGYETPGFMSWHNKKPYLFRVGDRVMQTKNHWDEIYAQDGGPGGQGIFNGDCGVIYEHFVIPGEGSFVGVLMDDGRRYQLSQDYNGELKLAYAMTIHKSQGCEYAVVIVSAQCSLSMGTWATDNHFLTRNLFYTAITRAKTTVEVIGSHKTVSMCIDTPVRNRLSRLPELLMK